MPKKRVLPYIVLGLLKTNGKMTGSEIDAEFQNEIGEFWQTTHSQIYPELKRMVAEDWLKLETSEQDKKKKWYQLRSKGELQLEQWLATPLDNNSDEEFPLKLFFLQQQTNPQIKSLLREELIIHQVKVDHLQERLQTVFPDEKTIQNNFGHHLILQRAIERETNNLHWLSQTLEKLPQ